MDSLGLTSLLGALDTSMWTRTVTFLGAFSVVLGVVKLAQGVRAVDLLPGLYSPLSPLTVPGATLPLTWWNPNFTFIWKWRKDRNVYRRFGRDTVSFIPFFYGTPTIYTRSLEVGRQILSGGLDAFDKSPAFEGPFGTWGPNIVDSYGDQWRRYRKISRPAFNNDTYAIVWDMSRKLFAEMMITQGWVSKDVIEVPSINSITFRFSLTVFTSVGFMLPVAWSKPSSNVDEPSVQDCLEIIAKTAILSVIFPSWAWKLPFGWVQRMHRAYETTRAFMRSQVSSIREAFRSEVANGNTKPSRDLVSLLVHASENESGNQGLSDKELIGNVFSFLFAGHDTTAHALEATLAFLALDVEIQDELASQVQEVIEGRVDGTLLFEDYGKLDKILAAFYEAIRMIPPGPFVPREAKHDVVLNISDTDEPKMLFVKKGTQVIVDLVGIHYHHKYYSDPEVYRPSRWYAQKKDKSSDVKGGSSDFTGFSFGPRACIGRKYSTTEAVCFLAHLLRDWRVEPSLAQHPDGKLETKDEWRIRVFQADMMITLGLRDYGIRFVRRR